MAQQWLANLSTSEPDLKGARLFKDNKAGGIGGNGVYNIYIGSELMCLITIPAAQNNKEEFTTKVREFLRGDTYVEKGPKGVNTRVEKGAAKIMGLTGIRFSESGSVTFLNQTTKPNEFSLTGEKNENQTLVWQKVNDTDLKLTVVEKGGATYEYPIRNGTFYFNEENKIR